MMKVLVMPVGLYKSRLLKEMNLEKPDKIYLIYGSKVREWKEKTQTIAEDIAKEAEDRNIEVHLVEADLAEYEEVYRKMQEIAYKEVLSFKRDEEEVELLFSVTSGPRMSVVAATIISSAIGGKISYIPPISKKMPSEYPEKWLSDDGGDPYPIAMPRLVIKLLEKREYAVILLAMYEFNEKGIKPTLTNLKEKIKVRTGIDISDKKLRKRLEKLLDLELIKKEKSNPILYDLSAAGKLIIGPLYELVVSGNIQEFMEWRPS